MLILLNTTEHEAPYRVIHKQSSAHKESSIVPDANKEVFHGEPQALATEIWGKICPPSDQKAIV